MTNHTVEPTLILEDQDGEIRITRDDLLKYTGQANVIAAALMIRVCHLAFLKLSPDKPLHRRKIYWHLGFPGAGLVDCVEMISHAVREGRCLQQPIDDHPEAPASVNGQFVFRISYGNRSIEIWPDKDIFDDLFRAQVIKWQELPSSEARQDYIDYKLRKVTQILSLPDEALLHFVWLK